MTLNVFIQLFDVFFGYQDLRALRVIIYFTEKNDQFLYEYLKTSWITHSTLLLTVIATFIIVKKRQ